MARPPEDVFDYVTNPANLAAWQTSKTRVEPESEGPPRQGYRVREWTKPRRGSEFEQLVEFDVFDRPHNLHVHIVEGPYPVDGSWTFTADGPGATSVHFIAEGTLPGLLRLLEPIVSPMMRREFVSYHENLRRNLEARDPGQA